jgi:cytochrome d ubiquinol oxidase subunit I
MGRQPWVVYGLLRTSNALSNTVKAEQVIISLIMFTLVYITLFILFLYLLNKKIKHGPVLFSTNEETGNDAASRRENPLMNQ